ncbi:lysozyme inhibitor LprI family protein [Tropicimonas marinistellae]|uniref:lysozyme inhibitor LprI family protein n=1 Tax=Tropicimonas marinistellae TaxID=1739787 RepID=UPI00122DE2DA|nr:lysozyme inhibitor LprI family protein [Tropicimonas marinistellae]
MMGCITRAICAAVAISPLAVSAQETPHFDPTPALSCLAGAPDFVAQQACIGVAAEACMASNEMGYTTVGMGYCFDQELVFWDARLNAAYGPLMQREKAMDAEMTQLGATVPSLAEALRGMQRAWIPYRDATCDYERAQWGNGTGGGPATLACLMDLTGRQALELERRLNDGQ